MERKSDPRTCRLLHFAANLAECRMYNGTCFTDKATGNLVMLGYNPDKRRGENLYAGETLEQMLEKYFLLADKVFHLDRATMDAFKAAMWYAQEGDNTRYFCHPLWQSVDAAMESAS